ncbi:peptidase S74 [Bacillus thuringiensis]|uniref:phage tail spike protein n=6 Tax=Bacillus TaxID=1386 RepID=UPI0018CED697|nr:phage tail spike protein [Bacillus thuringiensis]MBG9510033.1 peptidase S74 [Bacillus thuringiensis]
MSTPSGDLHVVDFKTNQIVSAIQPKDYWNDKRHWEIKNNIDTLEFRVFENTDHAATLVQQNLVLKEVRGGRIVPYVITETEKDSKDRSLMVYASGEWIQLAKAAIIEPQKLESKTLKQCMEIALKGTKWKIGKTEHDGAHSMEIEEFTNPLDFLKQIAASFEIEIQYRAEVVGSKIVGRYVDMVKRRGRDTRKEVTFGKDLIGIKRIENSQNICTALLGFVKKENGEFITISSINKGVPYLVDDAAYQRWNENGKHKFAFYTPQTDDQNMSPERLLTLMKTEMRKLVNASVSYGVDVQNIARIPNLSHEEINEGDTIRIIDEGFTPKLYLEARAIAGDESFKDPIQDNYVFGDYREIVDQNDELRRLYQKILSSLYDKVPQELFDQLNNKVKEQNKDIIDAKDKADQAQKESQTTKDLAEATQKYMNQNLVDIIEGANPPTTNLKPNKTLWRDISNGKPGILKIWTGVSWEPVVPDTAPLQQSIKDVKKDIETAKTELNQKVQSVEGKAQEIAGQIVDVQKQVNGKVDQTWINTQLKDKADKSGVFTKEEINNGFIGKQIYETDKQGNVQKFKDINTSIGQTNEALTQKAEKSELKKTNEGMSQLEQKTNEIKTTAEGTKQTLTELKTQVDNTKLDGRNSLKNSNFSSYIVNDSISWDKSLNGNLQASGWGSGYNGGVADPTKGYHAHLDITTFGYPVVAFINKNSIIGQKNRWLGIAEDVVAEFARNNVAGKEITISMDIWSDTKGFRINGGLHHFIEGNTAQSFHSGQYVFNVSEVNRWERYTFTMKLHEKFDVTKAVRLYIYGGEGIEGTAYVKNVKLELSNVATAWTPAPEDQVTTIDFTKKTVEIETTIKGINTTVSNIQNEQGKLTERVTKSEQTADGFKTSIESLTKKDTEISNKLNTVESTVEGTKKTISDVQQTTSELKKTTTEIKEEAGKVTEKLSSVEKKFDDMKIGGRNILLNTGGTLKSDIGTTVSNIVNKSFKIVPDALSMLQGQQFTISFKARTIGYEKGTPNPWAGVEVWIKYKDGEQLWPGVRCESDVSANQEWKTYSFTYNLKDKAIEVFNSQTLLRNVKGMIELKEWQIEIGNKATDYKPAAEDQVTTDEFTKKTTEIEKSVAGVKTTVSTVQKDQGAMQTTLNQVKQTTDSNSQTITSLSQTQGKQGEIVQQNTSDITQLNNQIKSKVTDTQMQEYVGGLGSTNLLFNTAFEDRVINATTGAVTSRKPSISKWGVGPNGSNFTAVPETARNHDGMNSVKLESSGQTVDRNAAFYQSLPVSPNSGDYVLSAWFYTDAVATIDNTAFVMIEFYNGSTWVTNKVVQLVPLLTNGSWKFVSVTMPSPASGVTTIRFVVVIRKNGRLWVSQPQLQQGITPSSFMENPKDYANYDQLVGEIAKKVATSDFDSKVSKMETTINQQSNRIDLKAEKTDVYTKTEANGQFGSKAMVEKHESSITLMSNEINSTVKKGDIISTINQTAEAVKISAGKIQLDGTTIAKYLEAQELKGTTIRTDNGSNYVHIQKQFIRLMESNLNRMFIGYYKRAVDSQIQPTILMHDDVDTSRFRDGTLTISQFPVKGENYYTGSFGIVKGYDADQTPHYCAKLNVDTKGDVSLNGDNYIYITGNNGVTLRSDKQFSVYTNTIRLDSVSHVDILTGGALFMKSNQNTEVNSGGHTIITSGKGISQYAKNGSYWVEVANGATFTVSNPSNAFWVDSAGGITLKGGSKSVWMDSQSSIVFNLKGKNMLDIVATPNAETDLRFQTVTLRNGNIDGYTTLQVKNGSGSAYNAVTASAFQTASKREYKTNIRDVQFSAIEKIMALQIQQYNLKTDIEDLYEKRMNRVEGDPILTTNDIETHYGWIADDENTPECFVTKTRNAAEIYSSVAIQIKAFQEEKQAKDAEIQELKEENKQMNSRIEVLEQLLLQNLIDKKPEQP